MPQNINRVILTGNLTRDPEMRTAGSTAVCNLRLAVNSRRKDAASGQWVDVPNYFDVVCFGAQAENINRYLAKGRPVAIDGRLDWREWEDKNTGQKRQSVQVIAEAVQFLGGADGDRQPSSVQSDVPVDRSGLDPVPAQGPMDDDIPF